MVTTSESCNDVEVCGCTRTYEVFETQWAAFGARKAAVDEAGGFRGTEEALERWVLEWKVPGVVAAGDKISPVRVVGEQTRTSLHCLRRL